MVSCFKRRGRSAALFACVLAGSFAPAVYAQQPRTAKDGVYTDAQAKRGQALYTDRCAQCHGATLGGDIAPPLPEELPAGSELIWSRPTTTSTPR